MKEEVKKWIDSNYKNYLKKNPPLENQIYDHLLDWLNSPEAESYLKRLDRVSVKTAIELSNRWTELINKRNEKKLKEKTDLSNLDVIYKFNDGYFIARLRDEQSYLREGVLMGHCVGSYYGTKYNEIYSLRDKNNNPHCTIEFDTEEKKICQIKGKANLEVVKKYHKYVAEFLNQLDFNKIYSYDIKNISSIYFGNYIFLNDEIPLSLEIKKSLNIEKTNFIHTFDKLIVNGDTFLFKNMRCKKIAKELVINGDLVIEEFHGLLKIADKLKVSGSIEITNCNNLKLIADNISAKYICIVGCENFDQEIKNIEFEKIKE